MIDFFYISVGATHLAAALHTFKHSRTLHAPDIYVGLGYMSLGIAGTMVPGLLPH